MLLNVKQVQVLLNCKSTKAYKVIKELNNELENKGYLTRQAYIVDTYLYDRYMLDKDECNKILKGVK